MFDEEDLYDEEPEPQELPEVVTEQPGSCCVCGKAAQRVGRSVKLID